MMIPRVVWGLVFALACATQISTAAPAAAPPVQVEFFSPQGSSVKQVRQAVARFSAPVVALGDPRLPDPFDIQCPAPGKGRWADTRNWVYDFEEDLPAGVRCTFTLKKGMTAASGAAITAPRAFTFDTGGPAIQASFPHEGFIVDEDQIFLLRLDAPATPESVRAHAYCAVEGIGERVPIELLAGEEREAVLAQRKELGYAYYQLLWKSGDTTQARVRDRALGIAEERIAVVKCQRRLPATTQVQLVWDAGIATASGIATRSAQKLPFRVRPAFSARIECTRAEPRAGCMPMQPINLIFSAPVPRAQAMAARLRIAGIGKQKDELRIPLPPERNKGAAPRDPGAEASPEATVEMLRFDPPFPDGGAVTVELPAGLKDDAGRLLENAARFPLEVRIDEFPPLVKFAAEFGILESKEGGVLPVTLRNVDARQPSATGATLPAQHLRVPSDPAAVAKWMQRVTLGVERKGEHVLDEQTKTYRWRESTGAASVFRAEDGAARFTIEKPAGARPAEVVGIPLTTPGFHVVEIASEKLGASLLGRPATRYVASAALVTNLAVHLKWGRESSRIWVTRLDTGEPEAGAEVTLSGFCDGKTLWQGRTDHNGIAIANQSFGEPNSGSDCRWGRAPLMASVKTADDFSFALSAWSEGISPYDFGVNVGGDWNTNIFHTVLDRPLFRAGETVSMKHFLRRHVSSGLAMPDPMAASYEVIVSHLGSDQQYKLKADFTADGTAEQQWKIPAEAKLGDYRIYIVYGKNNPVESGQFKVEEFRLPTMRASVTGPALPQVRPRDVTLDLQVSYLSGGGASGLPVKVRTLVERRVRSFPGYEDYSFGGEPVKEGATTSAGGEWDYDPAAQEQAPTNKTQVLPVTLDAQGAARIVIPDLPAIESPSQLVAELEYPDASGELLTASSRVQLVPSALTVGIRTDGWAASAKQMRFRVVVLDLAGKPLARQKVTASLYQSTAYSYRKRLIGGFYAYETTREIRKLPRKCEGKTDAQGLLLCEVAPGVSGEVLVRAEAQDAQGYAAGATRSMWLAGEEDWWFGGTEGDRMDVLPEQKEYEPGEKARFQVRMPFRSATALVTVEREGVLSSFVAKLSGRSPVIEVPIADSYAPNVYVSVLAVRGRVSSKRWLFNRTDESNKITALVDLNKPAFRLGTAAINVGWKPHRLDVRVTPERPTYRVREQARVTVEVKRANGEPLPAGAEVALAAVDEGLLEVASNGSWDLLGAMMGQRGLEVWSATAQMQVVGKRHYGRKAVPHGGGGGRERARESFETLLAWQGRVKLDAAGRALVSIPINDSLSSFRIVAVAHAGLQSFGTGSASIATTQDLILVSGLPPLVREGDAYAATFTVRNTTSRALTARVAAKVTPALTPAPAAQTVEIPPGEARNVVWQVKAPVGAPQLTWEVSAQQPGGEAVDRMKVVEKVIPAFPVRTYQATIAQLTGPLEMPTERPKGAVPGRGGLEVSLRAKLGDGLDGVREYMSFYPFVCLEQNLSRAVALRDRKLWDAWMARLPAYMDRDGLLKYFPSEILPGEDVLTAYVLAIAQEAGWEIPQAQQQRMVQGLTAFVEGRITRRSALETADLTVRKLAAIDALGRHGAAQPRMLDSITLEPNLWPTSAVIDWLGILRRVPGVAKAADKQKTAEGILRTRLNFQGTTMGFATEQTDALWWLMISTDSNSVRLLLEVLDREGWREDIPRLVRGALGRQQRGHWNTTVANAWGTLAMEKFSAAFESAPVTGATSVSYGTQQKTVKWPQPKGQAGVELPWQEGREPFAVKHEGGGKPWAMVRATAALPLDKPLSTGFRIVRTVTAVDQKTPGQWSRGDVMRVRLEVEAQSDMTWVVVEDPVPAGASLLGGGLNTQSQLLTQGERREGWVWPAYEERKFEVFRAYYRFVPKGKWTVEYTVRLNNPGEFLLPATRVEAMYVPEMLGEVPNQAIVVREQ